MALKSPTLILNCCICYHTMNYISIQHFQLIHVKTDLNLSYIRRSIRESRHISHALLKAANQNHSTESFMQSYILLFTKQLAP